ncbi:MAG: hypothetical protein R3F20_16990 [Planctomycetota bacterium]
MKRYRALSPEFLAKVRARRRSFLVRTLKAEFLDRNVPFQSNVPSNILNGHVVQEAQIEAFFRILLETPLPNRLVPPREALEEFLRERGTPLRPDSTLESVVACACGPVIEAERNPSREIAAGPGPMEGPFALVRDYLQDGFRWKVERSVQGCSESDRELHAAIAGWIFVRVGESCAPDAALTSRDAAIALAADRMKIGVEDYASRIGDWLRASPWAVILVRGEIEPIGATIVLPVRREFYDDVARGRRATWECTGPDIELPSDRFIVEAAVDRPRPGRGMDPAAFGRIESCLPVQIASQFARRRQRGDPGCRLLSFSATAAGTRRLRDARFKELGVSMARTGMPLMERRIERTLLFGPELFLLGLGARFSPAFPPA